ncbi:MAG: DinB family protein [Acidobacteriota bacterium]|nr:DinB family protein [Acidobacteriota bacterium]
MSTTAAETKTSPEFAAGVREFTLMGIEQEIPKTMKVIAAIPDAKRDWKPDPTSRSAWDLAWHLASEDVIFLVQTVEGKFNFPDPRFDAQKPNTSAELAEWYQHNMKEAIAKVRSMTPEQLTTPIDFLGMFKFPAVMYLAFMNSHSIHHRGQLSVYLRPMGSKVPSIYGPSADDSGGF